MDSQEISTQADVIYSQGAREKSHVEVAGFETEARFILHELADFSQRIVPYEGLVQQPSSSARNQTTRHKEVSNPPHPTFPWL